MRVGSLVELVDDNWDLTNGYPDEVYPVKKVIYTVRSIDEYGIRLEEIINPIHRYADIGYDECAFKTSRFRELMPPTSISLELVLENELQEA
jgi:hypothetical protein